MTSPQFTEIARQSTSLPRDSARSGLHGLIPFKRVRGARTYLASNRPIRAGGSRFFVMEQNHSSSLAASIGYRCGQANCWFPTFKLARGVKAPSLFLGTPRPGKSVARNVSEGFQDSVSMHSDNSTWRTKPCSVSPNGYSAQP